MTDEAKLMANKDELVNLTADIVAAHVSHNSVAVGDLPDVIHKVHEALARLSTSEKEAQQAKTPIVSVRASIKPDYLICLTCGRKQKTLRRHLNVSHGKTPDQYRQDYGLPDTYPMTAPEYSRRRREMARSLGLGRKRERSDQDGPGADPAKS